MNDSIFAAFDDVRGAHVARDGAHARVAERARTPLRPHMRILEMFMAPRNRQYLASVFEHALGRDDPRRAFALRELAPAMAAFAAPTDGDAIDLLTSDPIAQRGALRAAVDEWAELRRINRAFVASMWERLASGGPHDPLDDDEPYHWRAFESDSLRPPGFEQLNTGPLFELLEDQVVAPGVAAPPLDAQHDPLDVGAVRAIARGPPGAVFGPYAATPAPPGAPRAARCARASQQCLNAASTVVAQPPVHFMDARGVVRCVPPCGQRERFSAAPDAVAPGARALSPLDYAARVFPARDAPARDVPARDASAAGSDNGDNGDEGAYRTWEEALAAYYGEGAASSMIRAERAGVTDGQLQSWGALWQQNGGTRFMRYPTIPFWQKGGRNGYELDIEETLGTAARETATHVRRWDMSRMQPAEQSPPPARRYRHYGARQ